MKVLIGEYNHAGHHLAYTSYLLPALFAHGYKVSIAIPEEGLDSEDFNAHLAQHASEVEFHSLGPMARGSRFAKTRQRIDSVAAAVGRAAPDLVLFPSADSITNGYPIATRLARSLLGRDIPTAVCLHSGNAGRGISGLAQMARDAYGPVARKLAPWQRINFLNPLVYSDIVAGRPRLRGRFGTIPSPNPPDIDHDRVVSRKALGIPEDGRYIVSAGSLQPGWKGIERLLDAFRHMRRSGTDRLLLAGRIAPSLLNLINETYRDEVARDEIVMINSFLSERELEWAISAGDLVAATYPRFARVSGILLRAVTAGRPVVTDDCGWMGHVTRSYQLGSTCDVLDRESYADALAAALESSPHFTESYSGRLFRQYHSVENFQQYWLRELQFLAGTAFDDPQITWEELEAYAGNAPVADGPLKSPG